MVPHTEVDVAWMAGIFEGEGSIGIRASSPRAEVGMTDHDVMTHFFEIAGIGTLKGPALRLNGKDHWKPVTRWYCGGHDAIQFLQIIRPYLGARRRAKVDEAVDAWVMLRKQIRPTDTHCIHGHELTPDNVFTYSSHGRGCKTCRREACARYRAKCRLKSETG